MSQQRLQLEKQGNKMILLFIYPETQNNPFNYNKCGLTSAQESMHRMVEIACKTACKLHLRESRAEKVMI